MTLFCLLFTQLAVAAYACPDFGGEPAAVSVLEIDPDMPGCEGMQVDLQTPTLCAAHCDDVPQSADTPSAPAVTPFVQAALSVVLFTGDNLRPNHLLSDGSELTRTGSPPLIVRNCCFRI